MELFSIDVVVGHGHTWICMYMFTLQEEGRLFARWRRCRGDAGAGSLLFKERIRGSSTHRLTLLCSSSSARPFSSIICLAHGFSFPAYTVHILLYTHTHTLLCYSIPEDLPSPYKLYKTLWNDWSILKINMSHKMTVLHISINQQKMKQIRSYLDNWFE